MLAPVVGLKKSFFSRCCYLIFFIWQRPVHQIIKQLFMHDKNIRDVISPNRFGLNGLIFFLVL
jgi:hypothetical protein